MERFGNLTSAIERLTEGWRRPLLHYRIDEKAGQLVATAEMPGVSKDDIKVEVRGDTIQLRAESGDHKYRATVTVGTTLDEKDAEANFEDGILTIKAPLARPKSKSHIVKVR
jgi:HSP20 family protein